MIIPHFFLHQIFFLTGHMYHDKLIKNAHCPLIDFHIERKIQSWREESWWRHQSSVVVSLCRVNWPRAAQALTSAGAVAWKIDLPTSIKNDWTQKIKRQTVTVLNSKITRKIKKNLTGLFDLFILIERKVKKLSHW